MTTEALAPRPTVWPSASRAPGTEAHTEVAPLIPQNQGVNAAARADSGNGS